MMLLSDPVPRSASSGQYFEKNKDNRTTIWRPITNNEGKQP